MKLYKILTLGILLICFGCKDGYIDDITPAEPGTDTEAPDVTINYPNNGTEIKVYDEVTTINIDFEVTDDVEIASITLSLDGSEIAAYTDFPDYRKVISEYEYDNLTTGDHTLTVTATDMDGKTTSESVTFAKVPPYVPLYDGEILYMPFEGDMIDLVSVTYPTENGNPGFTEDGTGKVGPRAYQGAENAYLTFPADRFTETNEFSAVMWMKIDPDPNRAGILVIGPPNVAGLAEPNRASGFRFFREGGAETQVFKLNVGDGASDYWIDGGADATVSATSGEWVNLAITISGTQATVYIGGEIARQVDFPGISWDNTEVLSIMSGVPNFSEWNHLSDEGALDELRIFNKALSQEEIQAIILNDGGANYVGEFGEKFYMDFDGDYEDAATGLSATVAGSPGFAGESLRGADSYEGAANSYLTFPSSSLETEEFSASFWYKMNTDPTRAGILVSGPSPENPADNLLTSGFRLFREGSGDMQRFKLNVGTGDGNQWFDGGEAADVPATNTDWIHIAFAISQTEATVWIDGTVVSTNTFDGIDWADTNVMSIMSGAPNFVGWDHLSDLSYMDELRIFDRAITQEDVNTIIAAE